MIPTCPTGFVQYLYPRKVTSLPPTRLRSVGLSRDRLKYTTGRRKHVECISCCPPARSCICPASAGSQDELCLVQQRVGEWCLCFCEGDNPGGVLCLCLRPVRTYVRSRGFHGLGSTSEGPNWLACLSLCRVGLANSCPNIGLPQVVHRRTIRAIVSGRSRRRHPPILSFALFAPFSRPPPQT